MIASLLAPLFAHAQEYEGELGKGKINKDFCFRGELGWNKSWFTSLGVSYAYSNINSHSPVSLVVYAAGEVDYAHYSGSAFYAYKAGCEYGGLLFGMGIEFKSMADFAGKNHFMFTPKAGLTMYGHANLYWGYNVFKNTNNVFGIGHHQISISMNLNRRLLKESSVPKE
jgi:hypothetical protein